MAPQLRLPEPGSFDALVWPSRIAVASLQRLSLYPATEPYSSAAVYRFDDPDAGATDTFGICYTATTIEVAFAESVIHECGRFVGDCCEVPAAELSGRSLVSCAGEGRQTLVLANLSGAALKALGLNNDTSESSDYTASQVWARAIHSASPRRDGIRYVSQQMNKGFASAIFQRSGLRKLRTEKLKTRQLDELSDRFKVSAV